MDQKKLLLFISTLLTGTFNYGQAVSTANDLKDALKDADAGTTITLANGTWKDVFIEIDEKDGTSSSPITIQAETPGGVLMTGNSKVYMKGSYITVSGLVFQDPDNLSKGGSKIDPVFELDECDYCKVIGNKIDTYNGTESQKELTFKWVLADGQYNEIAYNSFLGKYGIGSIINDNRDSSEPDYLSIHHNYFADRTPINEVNEDNDQDAIRIGNSKTSLDNSFTEVHDNYFHNFFGEVEMISNKSGGNKYYNNTFRNYAGSLTLRHGDNCEVYGNYFFAEKNTFSAGVRVIGENHNIYNNYIEGVNSTKSDGSVSNATGGINVSNGRRNTKLNGYYRVQNTSIVNNTFVDCDFGLRVGTKVKSDLAQEPINLIVANNIMYNTENPYQTVTEPSGTNSFAEGNITNLSGNDLSDDGAFHRLTSNSPAINAGLGGFSFLAKDILDGSRSANFDAGAEEFNAVGTRLPFTINDVGELIGFGATAENALVLDTASFESLANKEVSLFPVPVTGGELTILSLDNEINLIRVYNIVGQEVLVEDAEGINSFNLNVLNLKSGVYFIALDQIGVAKFIIE